MRKDKKPGLRFKRQLRQKLRSFWGIYFKLNKFQWRGITLEKVCKKHSHSTTEELG